VTAANYADLTSILNTRKAMGAKPVIVAMALSNPAVVNEFEFAVDGLLVSFGVQDQAILEILAGLTEPSGLLPVQLPADMATVETQKEDLPHDMKCHKDNEGHVYDFGYGLNWKGVIKDNRTKQFIPKHK
jgi:beta-glucosidase